MVQEFLKPNRIVQKQPAKQSFKSCRQAIGRCITATGSTTGTITPTANKILFLRIKKRL